MERFFFKFQICFRIICLKPKNIQTSLNEACIDQKCNVLYILMDSSRQALQTNGKLFSNFGVFFPINYLFFKLIVKLGLC